MPLASRFLARRNTPPLPQRNTILIFIDIPGYRVVKVLGAIYGITVRSRNWGADIGSFLRSSVGGEIKYFTNLMYTSRNAAVERLVGECLQRGGNAIIALRFDQTESECCGLAHIFVIVKWLTLGSQYFRAGLRLWDCVHC
jgi:uncharacterized protein YbjQ (UPF0145 family)